MFNKCLSFNNGLTIKVEILMILGLIPNTTKVKTVRAVEEFARKLRKAKIDFLIDDSIASVGLRKSFPFKNSLTSVAAICSQSDMIVSFGGDGTLLNTAYLARKSNVPILGVNFGKLGFLAEFDFAKIDKLIEDIKNNNLIVEERMTLEAVCIGERRSKLFAVNDIIIDRGKWPKMMDMTLKIDGDYVSTFSADGVIAATPTGSTGYSLSTGGPIVSPKAGAITLNPISPHMLTMRPLILSSSQIITVEVKSHYSKVQVNCDGQRVNYYKPPIKVIIQKGERPVKLVHSKSRNYFDILREKLFWGLDLRNNKEV